MPEREGKEGKKEEKEPSGKPSWRTEDEASDEKLIRKTNGATHRESAGKSSCPPIVVVAINIIIIIKPSSTSTSSACVRMNVLHTGLAA
ncbi:unnamed protein product [Caenorhabditis sp. 36 PRJEB53466]|nr:unnamed protein product [Caenorhabditis sp. 36 PRJEB53466]